MFHSKSMSYEEVIEDLTSQGKFRINLGLERVSQMLDLLGNPQDSLKCIQVAGTNGKGSVCTMLSSILKEAGYKTGLYTSPHIFDYTERIGVGVNDSEGLFISEKDFVKYYSEIIEISDIKNIYPTEFEILTVMMFKYFYDMGVEVAVIETGLGGRFDATNVLKRNLCSIITHIDLDHTDRLGDTKDKIAFEKAGIIKPNSYIITSEGYEVIKDRADELNSILILTSPYVEPKYIEALSLKGEQQAENLALVLTAIKTVFPDIADNTVIEGLKKVKNPCRFQYIKEKNLIIDGAHNPNCFEALRRNLDTYFPNMKRNYVFGCLNTKDYGKMLRFIEADDNLNEVYIYHFKNENSMKYSDLKKVTSMDIKELKDIHDLVQPPYNIQTVVCGSFYMLNELFDKTEIFAK